MKRRIRSSLVIAIVCLLVGITLIVVNYTMDNTHGNGYSNTMSTLSEYHRSLSMVIMAIVLATASVVMMIITLLGFLKRKQAEDEELLRRMEMEESQADGTGEVTKLDK